MPQQLRTPRETERDVPFLLHLRLPHHGQDALNVVGRSSPHFAEGRQDVYAIAQRGQQLAGVGLLQIQGRRGGEELGDRVPNRKPQSVYVVAGMKRVTTPVQRMIDGVFAEHTHDGYNPTLVEQADHTVEKVKVRVVVSGQVKPRATEFRLSRSGAHPWIPVFADVGNQALFHVYPIVPFPPVDLSQASHEQVHAEGDHHGVHDGSHFFNGPAGGEVHIHLADKKRRTAVEQNIRTTDLETAQRFGTE